MGLVVNGTGPSRLSNSQTFCDSASPCAERSGAINSLLHWTHVIPYLVRRLDNIVVMVASPVPHRCAKR